MSGLKLRLRRSSGEDRWVVKCTAGVMSRNTSARAQQRSTIQARFACTSFRLIDSWMPLMYFSFHLCILYQFTYDASRYMKNGRMIEDNREARAHVQSQRSLETALLHPINQTALMISSTLFRSCSFLLPKPHSVAMPNCEMCLLAVRILLSVPSGSYS